MIGKPVRHRTRDSSWQWLMIGMTLGAGCSLVVCLTGYVIGLIEIGDFGNRATATVALEVSTLAITATSEPAAPVPEVTENVSEPTLDATPTFAEPEVTPTPTLLQSDATQDPTLAVKPDTTTESGTPDGIGTPFPIGGATITPSIGSASPVPDTVLSWASPLVAIPGGTFTMGTTREEGLAAVEACITRDGGSCTDAFVQDSIPPHQVTLNDFQIEIYEVSNSQYVNFLNHLLEQTPGVRVDKIGCSGQPCLLTQENDPQSVIRFNGTNFETINADFYANRPATYVTWWGADTYCRTLGRRLPTEAEWERAARGPANSIYPWGQEWIPENAKTSRPTKDGAVLVTDYPNGVSVYGVYNMAGNVSEWVHDFYQSNYYSLPEAAGPNPRGPVSSDRKVARGGGWDNVPLFARSVHRIDVPPGDPHGSLGFRCAADQ